MRHGRVTAACLEEYGEYFNPAEPIEVVGFLQDLDELFRQDMYLARKHHSFGGRSANVMWHASLPDSETKWDSYTGLALDSYVKTSEQFLWLRPHEIDMTPVTNKDAKYLLQKPED